MEKLYLWFNPKRKQVYSKVCRICDYSIGSYNQYGHILLTTLTYFGNKVNSDLSNYDCYKILRRNRDKHL